MNPSRNKSIAILIATLILGIVIGLLVPAAIRKVKTRSDSGSQTYSKDRSHRKEHFALMLQRVLKPDSIQLQEIKPVAEWAGARIDSVGSSANEQVEAVLDSVSVSLSPILTEKQRERLASFKERAQKSWGRKDKQRHR